MTEIPASDMMLAGQPIDLTNCDREPIHIPGSIQPHGCLLACDHAMRQVLHHSANAAAMLNLDGAPVGRFLAEVIGGEASHALGNALSVALTGTVPQPATLFGVEINGRTLDVTAHRFDERTIIEFEPATPLPGPVLGMARTVIGRLRAAETPERLIQQAALLLQAQLGYDRVMVYELGPDGAGKVVAEAKRDCHESFRGQYFPASDIPRQARALYLRNPIRVIGDVSFAPIPILPGAQDRPLDLSYAHLRSVSPIHCEYLRNMGVAASMSVSIILDGALWGLIACHHYAPRVLSMAERAAAEMVGEFFSMQLDTLRRRRARNAEIVARRALDDLMVDASRSDDAADTLRSRLPQLAELIAAEGVGLWFDGEWTPLGNAPGRDLVGPLLRLAQDSPDGQVFHTDRLMDHLPDAPALTAQIAGVLIVPLSQRPRDFLFYFRPEAVRTLDWGGDPNKTYETGPLGDRLTPRKSFAIWKETVRDRSHPWSEADLSFAEALRISVVEVLLFNSEVLADERTRAAVRQRVLNQELNHRVKNILAIIRSLVSQRPAQGETLDSYVETLRGRIQALAYAHDQAGRDDSGGLLRTLVQAELAPYSGDLSRIGVEGPEIALDARAFSVMALVLHELATNAVKYGALAQASGRLSITWHLDDAGNCRIVWRETGVPDLVAPQRTGFGSSLVNEAVPYDLGGESGLDWRPDGVEARFTLPARFVRLAPAAAAAPRTEEPPPPEPTPAHALDGRRVMLVEDQILIAMSLEADLTDYGLVVTGIAPDSATAFEMIRRDPPELAVLDVNLRNEDSFGVAAALQDLGVPFVFATGYGGDFEPPPRFGAVPVVDKPYHISDVLSGLRQA